MKLLILVTIIGAVLSCNDDPACGECVSSPNGDWCGMCWDTIQTHPTCSPVTIKVNNCLTYKKDGVCHICDYGYYDDSFGKCVAIVDPDCLQYDQLQTHCVIYKNKYPEKNDAFTEQGSCRDFNCKGCNDSGQCGLCVPGFHLTLSNTCVINTDQFLNCHIGNEDACKRCEYQYHLKDGICTKSAKLIGALSAVIGVLLLLL